VRSLAASGYSHDAVYERLHDSSARTGVRFDLLNENRDKIGELETVHAEERAALVEHNIDSGVKGALDLKMDPDERLRGQCYRRYVKPYWRIQMRDGGWAEFPFGVYVWTIPDSDLDPFETWSVVLPDQADLLNTQSPMHWEGFQVLQGQLITDAIRDILNRVGITDHSRVGTSEWRFDQPKLWFLYEPYLSGDPAWNDYRRIESELRNAEGLARTALLAGQAWYLNEGIGIAKTGYVTWLQILEELHKTLAWWPPHFDHEGRYVGKSALDANDMNPSPALRYVTDNRSIVRDPRVTTDVSSFFNLIVVSSTDPTGLFGVAHAWSDEIMPNHPLSTRRTGRVLLKYEQESNIDNLYGLWGIAYLRLFDLMNSTDKLQWTGHVNPAHEPYDFFTMQIPPYFELADPTLYLEHMYAVDLFTSNQEHGGYRTWIEEPLFGWVESQFRESA
jgi:hypothetical protein